MMTHHTVTVEDRPARLWSGGAGPPILLIHGAWAGAAAHWARVWEMLAARHQVIAPELPGIGDLEQPTLPSVGAYARWLESLLDGLAVPSAWVVGNSFGASIGWSFAGRSPARCLGLVLVNGGPKPTLPPAARWVFGLPPVGKLLRAFFRWGSFSASTLTRAFVDPGRAPAELVRVLAGRSGPPPQLDGLGRVLLHPEPPASSPIHPPLLLWGSEDRLWGNDASAAVKLQRTVRGARLVLIPDAGHCPQLEQPEKLVDALLAFIDAA
jgi:pimeloyl-ACP methyl ester carboxylesterase